MSVLLYYFCSWVLSGVRLVFAKHSEQVAMRAGSHEVPAVQTSMLEINVGGGKRLCGQRQTLTGAGNHESVPA